MKCFEFVFFMVNIIIMVGLGNFGLGYRALGINTNSQFFDWSFYWELGYNMSRESCYVQPKWLTKTKLMLVSWAGLHIEWHIIEGCSLDGLLWF